MFCAELQFVYNCLKLGEPAEFNSVQFNSIRFKSFGTGSPVPTVERVWSWRFPSVRASCLRRFSAWACECYIDCCARGVHAWQPGKCNQAKLHLLSVESPTAKWPFTTSTLHDCRSSRQGRPSYGLTVPENHNAGLVVDRLISQPFSHARPRLIDHCRQRRLSIILFRCTTTAATSVLMIIF